MLTDRLRDGLGVGRFPLMTRANAARELTTASLVPVAISMIEGGVAGVLAKKLFEVNEFQFATLVAAPMFANMTSIFWARLTHGRGRVGVINVIHGLLMAMVAAIGLLPVSTAGGWGLVAIVITCRVLLAGVITLRSTVWRNNYPRSWRGRITSRFVQRAMILLSLAPLLLYIPLDWKPELFRVIYPAAAAVGVMGAIAFSRVRVRREREQLRYERGVIEDEGGTVEARAGVRSASGESGPGYLTVLRHDHLFRRYMLCQMTAGIGNMMGFSAATLLIVDLTEGMRGEYGISVLLTQSIPLVIAVLTMPWFARLFDDQHITAYRLRHGLTWVAGQGLLIPAAILSSPWLFIAPQVAKGLALGGGAMAWNLGHNDFADRRLVSVYMGIHVTLTGVRGIISPYLGIALMRGIDGGPVAVGGLTLLELPAVPGLGWGVFVVTTALVTSSYVGFYRLRMAVRHDEAATRSASRALADAHR